MKNPGVIDRNQIIYGGQLGFKLQSKLSSNVKNSLFTPVNITKITTAIIKKLHNKYCLIHHIHSDTEVKKNFFTFFFKSNILRKQDVPETLN